MIGTWLKNIVSRLKQHWWGALIGVALATIPAIVLFKYPIGEKLVFRSYDIPFQFRRVQTPQEAVIVYLDEMSYQVLNQPYNQPWDRAKHAQLLRRLTKEKVAAVAYDIVFSDPGPDPKADEEFAQAIKENGKVILAADNVPSDTGVEGVKAKKLFPPNDLFLTNNANMGSDEMYIDIDGVNRQHLPDNRYDPAPVPSLSWMAAKIAGAKATRDESVYYSERWLNYYGPDRTIPSTSFYLALEEGGVPQGFFSNKVVFIGARLYTVGWNERKDAYPTPYPVDKNENKFMAGVEVQATTCLNIMREDWLRRLPRDIEKYLLIAVGMCLGIGLLLLKPIPASVTAAILAAGTFFGHQYLFTHERYWFPWMIIVMAQIPAALIWSVIFNSVQLYVQNRLLEQSLAAYVSPKRVKQIMNSREMLAPGAEKQMLTILFSDIENFTVLSEGVDSDELAKLMNRYFENAVSNCIFKTDGTVVKYIGDAIFSFWNAPEEQSDHQPRACEAALLLSGEAITIDKGGKPLRCRTRIGLHTGVANVGNFGSSTRIDYTALGENINLASRMEGLNKYLGTTVLITGDVKAGIGDKFVLRFCGKFILKGFEKAVEVYELVGMPDTSESTKAWRDAFAEALKRFQKGHFENAEAGFRCVLEMKPDDGPSKFYLKEIEHFRTDPPDADWQGEIELKEK